jgi:hypothetical protein
VGGLVEASFEQDRPKVNRQFPAQQQFPNRDHPAQFQRINEYILDIGDQ